MAKKSNMMPVISKMYCSSSQVVLGVRKRPHVVSGGGLVVSDICSSQKVVFKVDGCGVHGKKDELLLSDGEGTPLLRIRRKGCLVEAMCINKTWKAYTYDYEGTQKLVFSAKEPHSFLVHNNPIRITIEQRDCSSSSREFEVRGNFPQRECSIIDSNGIAIAQVGVSKEVGKVMESNDVYHIVVKPGIDQAFVVGVIAVLDYIYDGSTRC